MAKETGTTMAVVCCAVHYLINQTKEIVEPAPLMEYAYASSHMQISYFFRFRRQCLFPSFSLSARREKRALSPASVDCCCWWNVFHLSKEGKKNLCDGLKYEKFRGDALKVFHLFCAARQSRSSGRRLEEARVKTKVGSHVDDLNQQSTQR